MRPILLFADEAFLHHRPPHAHPERPERLEAILERLQQTPVPNARFQSPRPATREDLLRVHAEAYVEGILRLEGRSAELDADTYLSPGSVHAALLAAGAAIDATAAVCGGEARAAFSLARPPGHHAERARAMGFCLFNNVAIAAEAARARFGAERVLIVDWDVHHGNGSQHAFEDRNDVLFFSVHRAPFYPMTGFAEERGRGAGAGFTLNLPFPAGMGDADYRAGFEAILEPVAAAFRPDLVLISAGFDAHEQDPLGGMRLSSEGYGQLAAIVRRIADEHAGGRLVLILEGGYDLDALAESVHRCVEVLAGPPPALPPNSAPSAAALAAIDLCRAAHAPFWPTLGTGR